MSRYAGALICSVVVSFLLVGCTTNQSIGENFRQNVRLLTGSSSPATSTDEAGYSEEPLTCEYNHTASNILGGLTGALLGSQLAGKNNRASGAALGAAAGVLVSELFTSYLEKRCNRLMDARARMHATTIDFSKVAITKGTAGIEDDGMVVTAHNAQVIPDHIVDRFRTGHFELPKEAHDDIVELAKVYAGTDKRILIVGHTDAVGTPERNQALSEARALEVAKLFANQGIPKNQLYFKGAGESQPLETNETERGRSANRRVEVREMRSEEGLIAFDSWKEVQPGNLKKTVIRRTNVAASSDAAKPGKANNSNSPPSHAAAVPVPAVAKSSPPAVAIAAGAPIDFGGSPVDRTGAPLRAAVGPAQHRESLLAALSPIQKAYAADADAEPGLLDTACIADRYAPMGAVRSLDTMRDVHPSRDLSQYLPALYGRSWTQMVNTHLVGLSDVAVRRVTGQVDRPPHLHVYLKYRQGDQKAFVTAEGKARAYIGQKGILYRVFFEKNAWPVRCMDLVFSRSNRFETTYGELYYDKKRKVYSVPFRPTSQPVTSASAGAFQVRIDGQHGTVVLQK